MELEAAIVWRSHPSFNNVDANFDSIAAREEGALALPIRVRVERGDLGSWRPPIATFCNVAIDVAIAIVLRTAHAGHMQ